MRTTIRMNTELRRQAHQFADETGRTFTQVVEEAVTELLARRHSSRSRKKGPLPTYGRGGIVAGLSLNQAISEAYLADDIAQTRSATRGTVRR